ncbi:predicted protein [Histoplasma capsulatum G186AR]|uniref:Uncharacterized protein n=1 Tax=Ajellomyces capsulatus (strain G186AR / H82 / ATCC MYA-2454 / RMSCC 2432) TaxID=447093 RepID=C0NQ77_AJECG|nr:uncharacterized protein HCBG_05665 [Histoplasma capsulatum G186AR]EEH06349.1 predicted protein [Histoplasma capsulatum G186AR]
MKKHSVAAVILKISSLAILVGFSLKVMGIWAQPFNNLDKVLRNDSIRLLRGMYGIIPHIRVSAGLFYAILSLGIALLHPGLHVGRFGSIEVLGWVTIDIRKLVG